MQNKQSLISVLRYVIVIWKQFFENRVSLILMSSKALFNLYIHIHTDESNATLQILRIAIIMNESNPSLSTE